MTRDTQSSDIRLAVVETTLEQHAKQLAMHTTTLSEHGQQLGKGDVNNAEIRADIRGLADAIRQAVSRIEEATTFNWKAEIARAAINWGVPAMAVAVVWLLVKSQAVPVHP